MGCFIIDDLLDAHAEETINSADNYTFSIFVKHQKVDAWLTMQLPLQHFHADIRRALSAC